MVVTERDQIRHRRRPAVASSDDVMDLQLIDRPALDAAVLVTLEHLLVDPLRP
jgi:hypothetical protein